MKALVVLTCVLTASCLPGWTQLSPEDAYEIESKHCAKKPGDEARACQSMVDKKYGRYLSEGAYPAPNPGRSCSSPQDCR